MDIKEEIRNILETEYPRIEEIYIHYINTDEYSDNELIRKTEKNFYNSIDNGFISKNDNAIDEVTSSVTYCEQAGFTIGFAYAFSLIKEANKLNDLFLGGSCK